MYQQDFSGDSSAARKMSFQNRRGSSTTGSGSASGSAPGSINALPTDDYQSAMQTRSSSPGLHHHPQSLIPPQSQTSGAQVKKKSGFQITSVTPAQISVSTNNSIADDTESYDDMDESHTEDLSSSEMLDVSVSRATDTGVPERSSSDETLNSLHGVETPGAASPNEPLHPQAPPCEPLNPQGPPPPGNIMNGTGRTLHGRGASASPGSLAGGMSAGASGTNTTQMEQGAVESITTKSSTVAAGPGVDASSIGGACGVPPSAGTTDSTTTRPGAVPGGAGTPGSAQPGVTVAVAPATPSAAQAHAATGSRFRVVKLDSTLEPFRKGRWMCTEFYEKEVPAAAPTPDPAPGPVCPEIEAGSAVVPGVVQYGGVEMGAVAPQTLQGYQPPLPQDFPPQEANPPLQQRTVLPPVTAPGAPQESARGAGSQAGPQPGPFSVDQAQTGYPAPQLQAGLMSLTGSRPPDFIQPTAPLQSQVLPPGTLGVSAPGPTAVAHPLQSHHLTAPQQHPHPQNPSGPFVTTLRADLQPLLTHGVPLSLSGLGHSGAPYAVSRLEDAQRLLFQHQSLLALPRLGSAGGGAGGPLGTAADATGLKTQAADGEEDRYPPETRY
uniref:TSC22 domain family member 1 n=1 Tax=Esox lucius TaxID=8010 RepID=A0AAY5L4J3_ESOLU